MLKDGEPRRQSNTEPVNEYGGCSTLGGHDASLHQTPLMDMYADMGGVGCPDVERGLGLLSSPRKHAHDANIDPPAVMVGGPEEAHDELHTGEDNAEGTSKPTSNIATRIKDKPRMHTQSARLQSPLTRAYARKHNMTTEE